MSGTDLDLTDLDSLNGETYSCTEFTSFDVPTVNNDCQVLFFDKKHFSRRLGAYEKMFGNAVLEFVFDQGIDGNFILDAKAMSGLSLAWMTFRALQASYWNLDVIIALADESTTFSYVSEALQSSSVSVFGQQQTLARIDVKDRQFCTVELQGFDQDHRLVGSLILSEKLLDTLALSWLQHRDQQVNVLRAWAREKGSESFILYEGDRSPDGQVEYRPDPLTTISDLRSTDDLETSAKMVE